MDIYLIRHGEAAAEWGKQQDPPLSPLGHQQAAQACELLRHAKSLQLISSPLQRALQTSTPLAKMLDASVRIEPAFREIPSPAQIHDRQSWLRGVMQQQWPQQDIALQQWRDNAWQALNALSQPSAIFSHFLVINAMVGKLTGNQAVVNFMPANASVTHLVKAQGQLRLISHGAELDTQIN